MSATEATAEVFVTAFKSLKPRQREAVLERMLEDEDIAADIADTLALESRRHQPRQAISARSLKMLDKSAASLKKGMASPPVNLSRFRED